MTKTKICLAIAAAMLLTLAAAFTIRAADHFPETQKRQQEQEQYESLAEAVLTVTDQPGIDAAAPSSPGKAVEGEASTQVDFSALLDLNPDTVAWIRIPGAGINYPIVQAADNNAYLRRSFTGEQSIAGTLFLDFANSSDFSDGNSIVYGHNMFDGSTNMFSSLVEYKDPDFWRENPTIELLTSEGNREYAIFAVCQFDIATADPTAYYKQDFRSDEFAAEYAAALQAESLIDTGVSVPAGSSLLTLSTCDRSLYGDNGRLIVVGYLAG